MNMAELKKSHKKRKSKPKVKKRKPKLTKEFQETEREVATILDKTELSIDKFEEDSEAVGVAFFCKSVETNESQLLKYETPSSSVEESEQSGTPRPQASSSFIQIEDEDPIKLFHAVKLSFDQSALFIPSSSPNPYIQNVEVSDPILKPNANLCRLVNRYYEEGNHQIITSGASIKNQTNFFEDDNLYATVCERDFHPVFSVNKLGDKSDTIIPSRKLVALTIKELKFTEHPLQQEEHILANKLEELLYMHFFRIQSQKIFKLKEELDSLRKIANRILESRTTDNVKKLEDNLNKLKMLRIEFYQEEACSKKLLQNILDTWIKLKKIRKKQEFHWTTLKLKIKLNESDVDRDTVAMTKRFEVELKEIYREELETYYRMKRIRKSNPEENPSKPQKPNLENIKKNLKETFKECLRQPGQPEIEIIRSNLSDSCRPLDKIRSYYLRIFFDGQLVGSTRCYRLEPRLAFVVNESFGIYLERRIPKEITIKLYEKSKIPSVPLKIANILVPLPIARGESQPLESINFSSHKLENISGRLIINFKCDEGVYSEKFIQQMFPSPGLLTKISDTIKIDSPRANQTSEDEDQSKVFTEEQIGTCTFEENLLEFCTRDEIENNQRFRLLKSIYRHEMETKNIRYVSYLENELEEHCEDNVIEIGNWMDPIDVHKHNGKKYLRNLYEVVKNHCEQLVGLTGNSEELLIGNSTETLKAFFASLLTMFISSRSLNPERTAQPELISYQNIHKFNIVVNVVRATGIPIRGIDRRGGSNTSIFSSQTFKYSNVRPFVSVAYLDHSARTMTADGSSPTWNEQLVLQISGSPIELKGDLKIAIFDEYVENYINDELSMEVYQKFQSNWLGDYRLPIRTILAQQRIEGVFELDSPKILIGYSPPSLNDTIGVENIPEIKERVNLWLYVSVEPGFEMPQVITKNLECAELKEVRHHIHEWCIQVKDMQPSYFLNPLVCTMDGKRLCLTRLLEPIPLPIEISENLLESSFRYVALLNVLKNFDPCMYFQGIWLNNQTLLDTNWGSPKDLGILLANFLLTIGIRCWVVLGVAHPDGECAYVLYQDEGDFVMADPSTGRKYTTKDVYCPMSKVFYIFSQDNIFCNIQIENRVSMMSFDLEDSSCWFPMFNKKNPAPLGGVQNLRYTYRSSNNTAELRKTIERKIMKKISAWRPMEKTVWNRAFQSAMVKILANLEYESTFSSVQAPNTQVEQILAEFGNYKLFGFTLNFSYTNLSFISERIKSTGIHINGDKKVEFSVAVHINSYPNNVLSVWIFLISAIPK